jgi:uncharacterized membrane protein YfcA
MAGAWLGAWVGVELPSRVLQRAFALFLLALAIQLWWKS